MDINPEIAQELGLNEDQTSKISSYYSEQVATLKNEWDGVANENAEKIIGGAIDSTINQFGIDIQRQEGEKNKDFLARVNKEVFSKEKESIESLKADYQNKLQEFKGGDALKSELDATKAKLDDALQKAAQFDEWSENDYKGKYEKTQNEYSSLKNRLAYSQSLPKFSDDVNEYELKAKIDQVEKEIENKYTIEFDENNEAIAIDKENKYKVHKLKDLIKDNEVIQSLTKGHTPNGLGSSSKSVSIEGLPFKLKEGESPTAAISSYLESKGLKITSEQYSKEYEKLWATYSKGRDSLN